MFNNPNECIHHWRKDHKDVISGKNMNKKQRRFKCNFNNGACTYETTDQAEFRDHKRTKHLKIKCYTCDWVNCGKTFVNRSLVAHHIRIVHKNERLHHCVWPGCEQSFKRPINLKHHMATHTGVRFY